MSHILGWSQIHCVPKDDLELLILFPLRYVLGSQVCGTMPSLNNTGDCGC